MSGEAKGTIEDEAINFLVGEEPQKKEVAETKEEEITEAEEVIEAEEEKPEEETTEEETTEEVAETKEETKEEAATETVEEVKQEENLILGQFKTKEELDEYIQSQINTTKEAVKDDFEQEKQIEKQQQDYLQSVQSISGYVNEIEQAKAQLKQLFDAGQINIDEYSKGLEKAKELEFAQLIEYQKLEAKKIDVIRPKVQRENNIYYSKLEEAMPELKKDDIVSKHAKKLKEELFDKAGVSIQQDFEYYLKDYIIPLAQESEARGYARALKELDTKRIKDQQKGVSSKENPKPSKSISVEDDIINMITK